jgi:hypothetical protein
MPGIQATLNIFDKFIDIAKEIAKLPALVLPQYQTAAQDMYRICQKLLTANENLSRWLNRFIYFDFRAVNARSEFLRTIQEYKTMKNGPQFQQLKFSCHDISSIYYQNISSKIGNWFANEQKREEVEGIFNTLTDADSSLVDFTYDHVIAKLDLFVNMSEQSVDSGMMDDAEKRRLEFKAEIKVITERLEKFSNELTDLVINFAEIARISVTLGA